jgi:hypothetical protein
VRKGKENMRKLTADNLEQLKEVFERLEDIVNTANSRIRSDLSFVAGDLEDLELNEAVEQCYNIVDSIENLERIILPQLQAQIDLLAIQQGEINDIE